jgi:signal transduction histidine kinase
MHLRVLISLLLGVGLVRAQSPLPADGSFSARNHIQYLSDSLGQMTLMQVWADSAHFLPVPTDIAQLSGRQQPHWFRARLANPTAHPVSLIAEIDYPFLDSTTFFLLTSNGQPLARSKPLSWAMPLRQRPLEHQNPLFSFTLSPRASAWLYFRVKAGKMRLTVPLRLHSALGFVRVDRQQRAFWSITIGLMGFTVFFSLFLFVLLRDRIYAFYGLYVLASLLYLTGNQGYWLLWLDQPAYGFVSALDFPIVSLYVAILASFWLIRVYILPPVIHHRWIRRLYQVSVAGPIVAIGLLLGNVGAWPLGNGWLKVGVLLLEPLCYMIPLLLMPALLVYLSLGRPRPTEQTVTRSARLYLLAIALPLIQVFLGFLRERNLVPDQFINREGAAIGSMIEFAILIIALGYRYKRIADERRYLTEASFRQQQLVTQTQLRLQQQENRALKAQLQLQQEKERISRDLHDHVGAQLSVIAANANGSASTNGTSIGEYAREAMQSLRDTVWAIDQPAITLADFRSKLQQYLNRQQLSFACGRLTLAFDIAEEGLLSSGQALNLFRQVQEAVNNAFKHARASQIVVHCQLTSSQLTVTVTDDGVGFDPAQLTDNQPHYGLRNLKRRATDMGGECSVESASGRGTRVFVSIPLTN